MKAGDYIKYKGRQAEILSERYGLIYIRYLDTLICQWVNISSCEKL